MADPKIYIYFLGPAGAGKSTMAESFSEWCERNDIDTVLVNLDPGAEDLPYEPEVDVRDYISTWGVMKKYGLGPNGAQIIAADLMINYISEIKEALDRISTDYVLIDTPGQIELFAYRPWGPAIVRCLEPIYSHIIFVMDPFLSHSSSGFVSQILLALSVHFRIPYPTTFVMNKMDLLSGAQKERILRYIDDWDSVFEDIMEENEGVYTTLGIEIYRVISEIEGAIKIIPTSAMTQEGFSEIYYEIQLVPMGGDDIVTGRRDIDFEL